MRTKNAIESTRGDSRPSRVGAWLARAATALALCGAGGLPAASAAVIHDTTGSLSLGGFYSARYEANPCGSGDCFATAQDFDVLADHTLTSISIPLSVFPGSPNKVRISLFASAGGLPGAVLESWLVVGQMPTTGFQNTNLLTVTSVQNLLLSQGSRYFVGFDLPEVSSFFVYSPGTSLTETGTLAQTFDHGATWTIRASGTRDDMMAFRVEGDLPGQAVPVPGTAALALLALTLVGARRRVR